MHDCRLVIDAEPRSGAWNMAIDEALLQAAATQTSPVVRLYQWQEPTVSLGYFQPADAVDHDERLRALPAVRRLSGGGAIVHDREWTYSCVLPNWNQLVEKPHQLYERIHRPICEVLNARGASARLRGEELSDRQAMTLCFLRGDPRDIVIDSSKVLGSAQRRRRNTLLQHGSLITHRSRHAEEIPGVCDLCPDFDTTGLEDVLGQAIAFALSNEIRLSEFTPAELEAAERLANTTYANVS